MWVSYYGDEAVVRLLLERGADATLRSIEGRTALSWARYQNRDAVVALLKAHGAPE
jgi:ankyrin repeat protein